MTECKIMEVLLSDFFYFVDPLGQNIGNMEHNLRHYTQNKDMTT